MNRRLAAGAALSESLWLQVLREERAARVGLRDPGHCFLDILRDKLRYARGYHADVELSGRTLDAWFGEEPFDGPRFLDALADSPWVDRARPKQSRLLTLLAFGGPMFGIFTETETAVLNGWLASLAHSGGATLENRFAAPAAGLDSALGWARVESSEANDGKHGGHEAVGSPRRCNRRELFQRLMNVEGDPAALPLARQHAERILSAPVRGFGWGPEFPYSEPRFVDWLERKYRDQLRAPKTPRLRPLLSRAAYRFGIEQLAPAVLIDGCWLQRVEQLHADAPEVARRLRSIYADELGNGVYEQNHPGVYRRLLQSLGIDLPAVASPEFSRHRAFLDSAFDLPVFMLAISLSPQRFLPELLGLNLAIELSGLGTAYSRVAGELEHWGINALIVRLHQSIDNLASGHAALAKECVILHLQQARSLGGEPTVQQHWHRIWSGYRSLGTVTRRFRWELVGSCGMRVGSGWIRGLFGFSAPGKPIG